MCARAEVQRPLRTLLSASPSVNRLASMSGWSQTPALDSEPGAILPLTLLLPLHGPRRVFDSANMGRLRSRRGKSAQGWEVNGVRRR